MAGKQTGKWIDFSKKQQLDLSWPQIKQWTS